MQSSIKILFKKILFPTSLFDFFVVLFHRPVQIVGGEQTLFALTGDGKVYATGYGAGGRLGVGGTESVSTPTPIDGPLTHVVVTQVAVNSGGKHCLARTDTSDVYSWGEGDDGKLGHGTKTHCEKPRLIEALRGKRIVMVACGGAHSAAISASGYLYTWGKGRWVSNLNSNGQKTCNDLFQIVSQDDTLVSRIFSDQIIVLNENLRS